MNQRFILMQTDPMDTKVEIEAQIETKRSKHWINLSNFYFVSIFEDIWISLLQRFVLMQTDPNVSKNGYKTRN